MGWGFLCCNGGTANDTERIRPRVAVGEVVVAEARGPLPQGRGLPVNSEGPRHAAAVEATTSVHWHRISDGRRQPKRSCPHGRRQ